MAGTRDPRKPKTPRYTGRELCTGRIEFNPAPDAGDRLRRLFTILAKLVDDSRSGDVGEEQRGEGHGRCGTRGTPIDPGVAERVFCLCRGEDHDGKAGGTSHR